MKCEICQEREASIFLHKSFNDEEVMQTQLCPVCAGAIREGRIRAENAEERQRLKVIKALLSDLGSADSVDTMAAPGLPGTFGGADPFGWGFGSAYGFALPDDPLFSSLRSLIQRFNRPTEERSLYSMRELQEPFRALGVNWRIVPPEGEIRIPDPEARRREERAARLVFHDDGSVSLDLEAGKAGEAKANTAEGTDSAAADAAAKDPQTSPEPVPLSDERLRGMSFAELQKCVAQMAREAGRELYRRRRDLAVAEEDYELAAKLRDALKEL